MNQTLPRRRLCFAALLLTGVWLLDAQPLTFGRVKDFSVPDYFEEPHQNQVKSRLTGKEAVPQPGGVFLLKEVRLESFRTNGLCEFRITAPAAIYDSARQEARSDGALRVESGDGQFVLAGRGFLWQQTNSVLIISNDVRTTLNPSSRTNSPAPR